MEHLIEFLRAGKNAYSVLGFGILAAIAVFLLSLSASRASKKKSVPVKEISSSTKWIFWVIAIAIIIMVWGALFAALAE